MPSPDPKKCCKRYQHCHTILPLTRRFPQASCNKSLNTSRHIHGIQGPANGNDGCSLAWHNNCQAGVDAGLQQQKVASSICDRPRLSSDVNIRNRDQSVGCFAVPQLTARSSKGAARLPQPSVNSSPPTPPPPRQQQHKLQWQHKHKNYYHHRRRCCCGWSVLLLWPHNAYKAYNPSVPAHRQR